MNTKQIKRIFAFVLIFFLFISGIQSLNEIVFAASTGTKDIRHIGVDPARTSYSELSPDKDQSPFVYDGNLDLKQTEVESFLKGTTVKFHKMNGTVATGNGTTGTIVFSDLSQESLLHNNTIYASIGFIYSGGSYAGILPLKVTKKGNDFGYQPFGTTIHVFETKKDYYGVNGGTSTPVAAPVITKDNTTMVYFVSQWFIKYTITNSGLSLSQSKQVLHNNAYPAMQYSIGGPPIEDPASGRIYVGSWNGHVYKVNPSDLSYVSLNVRKFDVFDGDGTQSMINAARISSTPTVATKGSTKRIVFGITTNSSVKNQSGGFCSTNDSFGDIKCTIESYYYAFNSNGSRISGSQIKTKGGTPVELEAVVDASPAWSTKQGYGFFADRRGNLYAYDINGKVRYKNTSFVGSLVWASPTIDKDHYYGYLTLQSLRSGTDANTFGSSLYSTNECNSGRVIRFDINDIAYDLNNSGGYGVIHSQLRNYNLKSASDMGGSKYVYTHAKWLTPNEATGIPFIMGKTVVQSMTGCSSDGQVGRMFAVNAWYDKDTTPIDNKQLRENINTSSNGGTLNFLMDTSNKDWINVYSMGQFAGPIAGFNFSPYHDEGITINSGKGLTLLYIQNSDFDIVDLSVKSHETDGKFYQIDPAKDSPTEIYEGHVRVVTSPKKRLSIPKAVYDSNTKLRISVYHTNNPVSSSTDNVVCGDPYGIEPCKYIDESSVPTTYNATNLLNNFGNSTNYSKSFRELYRFDVPVQSLPVKKVTDAQGGISYVIEPGTPIVDKTFDVFKHNYSGSANQKHHLIAYVDVTNTIREKNESTTDNMVYRPIVYGGKGIDKPDLDLACTIQKPSGQYYNTNQDYNLNLEIKNTSKEKFVDIDFDYLVKFNGNKNQSGIMRANNFPGGDKLLQAGEKINIPLKIKFASSGNYKVQVDVNSTRASGPLLEGNNYNNICDYDVSATYPSAVPDLASIAVGPTSQHYKFKFDASGNAINANDIQINGVVKNLGFQRIDVNTKTKMYVYHKNTLLNGGKPITSDCLAVLATNASCATSYTLKPNEIKQGVYTVKLVADSTNNLVESNEYNNTRTTYFFIDKAEVGVPNSHFSPNGGGIKDKTPMSLSSGLLTSPDYTYKMEIGIFDQKGEMVKSIATKSTSFRYPEVGDSVYYSPSISSYRGNYLNSTHASNLWGGVPKTSGNYMWNGFSDRSGTSTSEKDGLYRLGIRYTYEIPNPNYVYAWTKGGCYYYNTAGAKTSYDCYLPDYNASKYLTSKAGTITKYGTETMLDNTLEIYNVVLKNLNNIRSGSYLQFENIQTRLEASEVWLEIPKDLIILNGFHTTNVTTVGNYYKVPLVANWSTTYKNTDTFRCNGDPYCNQWNIDSGDGIILSQKAPDGNHEIRVVAITRTDTPNSPKMEILNIQLGDSYDKHIKINENQQ